MREPIRWTISTSSGLQEDPDGELIEYKHYEALLRRHKAAIAALKRVQGWYEAKNDAVAFKYFVIPHVNASIERENHH